jgi:acylphosphatase
MNKAMRIFLAPLRTNCGVQLSMNFGFRFRSLQHFVKVFCMITQRLRIRGRVQGVGYREALRDEAARRRLAGWVRNRTDGSVEALLQGDADGVAQVVAWARRGPPASRVDDVQVERVQDEPPHAGFERRATV